MDCSPKLPSRNKLKDEKYATKVNVEEKNREISTTNMKRNPYEISSSFYLIISYNFHEETYVCVTNGNKIVSNIGLPGFDGKKRSKFGP